MGNFLIQGNPPKSPRMYRWLTGNLLVRSILLVCATLLAMQVNSQTITVDGDPSDWPAVFKNAVAGKSAQSFRRDANSTNDDQWTGGSKDPSLVQDWYWVLGNTNDKGDISNAGVVLIGKTIFFFGDRTAVNGDAQIGFWFLRGGIAPNNIAGKGGFRFSGVNMPGDILAISNFINGGGSPTLQVYKRDANLVLQPDNTIVTKLETNKNQQLQYVPPGVKVGDAGWPFSESWSFTPKSGGGEDEYPDPLFFEGSIDFTNEQDAQLCFNTFLLETRNSQSLTASLQDFVTGQFNVAPKPPTVTPWAGCIDKQPVVLSASCSSTGSTPRWYANATGGSPLTQADGVSADGSTLTKTGLSAGEYTYYVSCYNASVSCESDRVAVKATVYALPSVDAVVTEGENDNSINDGIMKLGDDQYQINIAKTDQASLKATGSGGNGSYSYQWKRINCDGSDFVDDGKTSFTPSGGTATLKILNATGIADAYCFRVTVTDGKTCVAIDELTIVPVAGCPPCGISGPTQACQNSKVTYTYIDPGTNLPVAQLPTDFDLTWTLPDGSTVKNQLSVEVTLSNTGTNTVTLSFSSLSGLINCNPCSLQTDVRQVSCTAVQDEPVKCNGESNGKATVTPANGFAPYTYLWDNGETTATATGLNAGKHTVTVEDSKGCKTSCEVTIGEPPALSCTAAKVSDVKCNGESNGSATVTPTGGNGGYTYLWDNGETSATATGLNAGKHTVTVEDSKGCKTSCEVTIGEPPVLSCTVAKVSDAECGRSNGSATVTPTGGNGGYTYLWDNGETSATAVGLSKGLHSVQVTDSKGCKTTCNVTIGEIPCAHIFPTQTACCNYTQGTAQQQEKVCYTKSGDIISNAIPGVFFYYADVIAPASGPFVITVSQQVDNAGFKLFSVQNLSQLRLTTMDCSTNGITFTGSISGTNNSQATFTVTNYTPGARYVVSVKYDTKSILGSSFAGTPTANYTFGSVVNGTLASGTTGILKAVANCSDDTPETPACTTTTLAPITAAPVPSLGKVNADIVSVPTELKVNAYPNPFTSEINFRFVAPQTGKANLELYDMLGRKVAIVYSGDVKAGEQRTVTYRVPEINKVQMIYRLNIGGRTASGSVLPVQKK